MKKICNYAPAYTCAYYFSRISGNMDECLTVMQYKLTYAGGVFMKSGKKIFRKLNPHLSVDCVIFGFDPSTEGLKVLLIERGQWHRNARGKKFFKTFLALPGNLIRDDEDLDVSAKRVLKELTGLDKIFLQQFYAFGDPDRVKQKDDVEWLNQMRAEPQARVVTVGYYALVKLENYKPTASGFAKKAEWFSVSKVEKLAFDHNKILEKALETLKYKINFEPIGFELLPNKFTLTQLQKLYETILEKKMDKRNFRRKILQKELLIRLKEKQEGVSHKRPQLFSSQQNNLYPFRKVFGGNKTDVSATG